MLINSMRAIFSQSIHITYHHIVRFKHLTFYLSIIPQSSWKNKTKQKTSQLSIWATCWAGAQSGGTGRGHGLHKALPVPSWAGQDSRLEKVWGVKNKEPDFPARQNFNMVVYVDLVMSLTKLLTDVNRDFQIKDLSWPAWRKNLRLCQRDPSDQRRALGITDTARLVSRPSVFGLALGNEKCQKGEDEKKNQNPNN